MALKLALTSLGVFQFVDEAHTKALSKIARLVEKQPGEAVVLRGEAVVGIYIVVEGACGVYAAQAAKPLALLPVGESFGEMSFLQNVNASATVRAEMPGTQLVLLRRQDLAELVETDADLGRAVYRGLAVTLSQRLALTTNKIASELAIGRRLAQDLTADGATGPDLAALPGTLAAEAEALQEELDGAAEAAAELARKPGERALAAQVAAQLGDARTRGAALFPRLTSQLNATVAFIQSMEDLSILSGQK